MAGSYQGWICLKKARKRKAKVASLKHSYFLSGFERDFFQGVVGWWFFFHRVITLYLWEHQGIIYSTECQFSNICSCLTKWDIVWIIISLKNSHRIRYLRKFLPLKEGKSPVKKFWNDERIWERMEKLLTSFSFSFPFFLLMGLTFNLIDDRAL